MTKQIDLFELTLPKFQFTHRPIKLFEAFAGIGCQAMALKKLGVEYETVGISEIDKYAIMSYNAIHGKTKNYGDISKMDHIPECDIFTWSFPCTDLSKAGKREGLQGGTRSGLVYEVLRLLQVSKPKVLIMENVPDLIQASFVKEFGEIRKELEDLGYSNYVERLNAKDYGVAQNRDRVFMVSVLGDWYYEFPQKVKLEKRLKDYLEDEVDERYYIDDTLSQHIEHTGKDNRNYIQYDRFNGELESLSRVWRYISPTLHTKCKEIKIEEPKVLLIPEATKQGYSLAKDGDGVYLNRPHQKRGVVQKDMIQTIKTSGDDIGVVVDTYNKKVLDNQNVIGTITANTGTYGHCGNFTLNNGLRIRKLTPKECWRLMGISDEDFDKASKVVSNSQLYKQAGNGIVVDVFAVILKNLF